MIDPHTAIGIGVLKKLKFKENIVTLATAHPAKFYNVVKNETQVVPELPANLKKILIDKENYKKLPNNIKVVQNYILEKI